MISIRAAIGALAMSVFALIVSAQSVDDIIGTWLVDPAAGERTMHSPPLFRKVVFSKSSSGLQEQVFRTTESGDDKPLTVIYAPDGRSATGFVGSVNVKTIVVRRATTLEIVWRSADGSLLRQTITPLADHKSLRIELSEREDGDHSDADQVLILRRGE